MPNFPYKRKGIFMTRLKGKKRLTTLVVAFMMVFIVGAAFAATPGNLHLDGTARVYITDDALDVIITSLTEVSVTDPDSVGAQDVQLVDGDPLVTITPGLSNVVFSPNDKLVTFDVNFTAANQVVNLAFAFENVGILNANINGVTVTAAPAWLNVTPATLGGLMDDALVGGILPIPATGATSVRTGAFAVSLNAGSLPDPVIDPLTDVLTPLTASFTLHFTYVEAP